MNSISDLNAFMQTSMKSSEAVLDILRQLAMILELFEQQGRHIKDPNKTNELNEAIGEVKKCIKDLQDGNISVEEAEKIKSKFSEKYNKIEVDEILYPNFKKYIEEYCKDGKILCYSIDRMAKDNEFEVYFDAHDKSKILEIMTLAQNSVLNKEELTKEELKEFSVGSKIIEIQGLTLYDVEMLRDTQNNFKYSVNNTKNGPVIYISDKDQSLARNIIQENRNMLKDSVEGNFTRISLIEQIKTRDLLSENISSKNNKTVYVSDKTKDHYIKISDYGFEEYLNGEMITSGLKKNKNEYEYLNNVVATMGSKSIIDEVDFKEDFSERIKKESLKESFKLIISGQKPNLDYEKHLLEEKKLDNYKSIENFGRTTQLYDFTKTYLEAVLTGNFNEEKENELLEHFDEMDLDEKEEVLKVLSGLSTNEIQTLSNYLETYIEENDISDHIEFIEIENEEKHQEVEYDQEYEDYLDMGLNDLDDNGIDDSKEDII